MPPTSRSQGPKKSIVLVATLLTVTTIVACTRDPFDRNRPVILYESEYTYQPVIAEGPIASFNVSMDATGRMGLAAVTDLHEVTVLENAAGAWVEAGSITASAINGMSVDIAPGALGAWWVLASASDVGMRLYRVGGAGDSSLTIPLFNSTPWDSVGAVLASDPAGRPVAFLKALGLRLVRATLADTGWALDEVLQTTSTAVAWDAYISPNGVEHLVYQRVSTNFSSYRKVDLDSIHASEIPQAGVYPALAVTSDETAYVAGSMNEYRNLRLWRWAPEYTADEENPWIAEVLPAETIDPFTGRFAVAIASDETPHVLFAAYDDTERISIIWASRNPDFYGINWTAERVAADIPWRGFADRRRGFRLMLDAFDAPHFFFLIAASDILDSTLYEAVPRP